MFFKVSALKKEGIKELLEGCLLQAEVRELKANPNRPARGVIIESKQDRGRGVVATVLVQNGTLKIGDIFVCGALMGRVRSMTDDAGERLTECPPGLPVEITGLSDTPLAGDELTVVENEQLAREVTQERFEAKQRREMAKSGPMSLEEFARRANSLAVPELNLVVKADVHGSVEAVVSALEQIPSDKVRVRIVHSAVGGITESDVQLAVASKAIIVGFNVRSEARASREAESLGVDIRYYRVIYELIDEMKMAMAGLLSPIKREKNLGRAEVREVYTIPKIGTIAGCSVQTGLVRRSSHVRLLRDSTVIYEGGVASLRRFKDDVSEVQHGLECGISLERFNDIKQGDVIEVFDVEELAPTLE